MKLKIEKMRHMQKTPKKGELWNMLLSTVFSH